MVFPVPQRPAISTALVLLIVAAPGFAEYAANGRPDLRLTATLLLLGIGSLLLFRRR